MLGGGDEHLNTGPGTMPSRHHQAWVYTIYYIDTAWLYCGSINSVCNAQLRTARSDLKPALAIFSQQLDAQPSYAFSHSNSYSSVQL